MADMTCCPLCPFLSSSDLNQLTHIPSSTHPSHHHGHPHPPLQPKDFPPLDPHMAVAQGVQWGAPILPPHKYVSRVLGCGVCVPGGGAHAHQQHELLLSNGTVVENLLARKLGPGRTQLRLTSNSKGVLTQVRICVCVPGECPSLSLSLCVCADDS